MWGWLDDLKFFLVLKVYDVGYGLILGLFFDK